MNILIVDDEKLLCWALKQALTEAGHKVRIAADAEEAWELVRTDDYDAIITDLRLKGMSGLDLLTKVKARNPGTRVVVMTASGSRASAHDALDRGALGVVEKPFDFQEILTLLGGQSPNPSSSVTTQQGA